MAVGEGNTYIFECCILIVADYIEKLDSLTNQVQTLRSELDKQKVDFAEQQQLNENEVSFDHLKAVRELEKLSLYIRARLLTDAMVFVSWINHILF